jgi:predicted transcriptional regulator
VNLNRQKNFRVDDLTLSRLEELAEKWSQAEPLNASAVIRECVRRVHETETKTKTKTSTKTKGKRR